jgi:hypothetical protein
MAKQSPADPSKIIDQLPIDPLVVRTALRGPKSEATSVTLLFDSRLAQDETRALWAIEYTMGSVSVTSVESVAEAAACRRTFELTAASTDANSPSLQKMATITIDFAKAPFLADSPERAELFADRFLTKLRDRVLLAFADVLYVDPITADPEAAQRDTSPPKSAVSSHVPNSPVHQAARAVPPKIGNSGRAGEGGTVRRRWLIRGGVTAAAVATVLLGINLLGPKSNDPFAGQDPMAAAIERGAFRGANNPAMPNVTVDTLKSMGFDPGKANAGCLAK